MTTTQQPVDPAPDFQPVDWPEVTNYPSSAEKLGPLWQMLWTLLGRATQPVRQNLLTDVALKKLEAATGVVAAHQTSDNLLTQAAVAGAIGRIKLPNRGPRVRANTIVVWHFYRLDRWTPGT